MTLFPVPRGRSHGARLGTGRVIVSPVVIVAAMPAMSAPRDRRHEPAEGLELSHSRRVRCVRCVVPLVRAAINADVHRINHARQVGVQHVASLER
jgi:hypothetical protein